MKIAIRVLVGVVAGTIIFGQSGCKTESGESNVTAPSKGQSSPGTNQVSSSSSDPTGDVRVEKLAEIPSIPLPGTGWKPLFDGKSMTGWQTTLFGGHGEVEMKAGLIEIGMGDQLSGVNWTNDFPDVNYEIALDAMRVEGSDFFCGLTFPVKDSSCSLILGGWGGAVVGLSSINGEDASENETTQYQKFEKGKWYRVRVRVTEDNIQAWLDEKNIIDVSTEGKKISLRYGDIERSKPLGIATWQTTGAVREIKFRRIYSPTTP
jgi:3-keto-disaccharide hydrolase